MKSLTKNELKKGLVNAKLLLGPPSFVLDTLRTASLEGDGKLQNKMTCLSLAQFAVVNNQDVTILMQQIFSFVKGAKTVAGIESLFLSGLAHLRRTHQYGLYEYGVKMWLEKSRKLPLRKSSTHIIFLDREFNMVTFLPGTALPHLVEKLEDSFSQILNVRPEINKTLLTGGLGDIIRDPRGFADAPWDHGYSQCQDQMTGMGAAAGFLVGNFFGGDAGGLVIAGVAGGTTRFLSSFLICDDPKQVVADSKPQKEPKPEQPTDGPDMGTDQPAPPPATSEPTTNPSELQSTSPEDNQSTPDKPFIEIECTGYPNPDAPDETGRPGHPGGNPLASFAEPLFYPNPETGLPGGPAGMPLNFLMHSLPKFGVGNQPIQSVGFFG